MARGDVVYLHGRLPSYFLKQLAQEITAGVDGVRRVINRIDVLRPAHPETGRPG
jgi:osmotically-inducible protein OsmY